MLNPCNQPAMPVGLFEAFQVWQHHDGSACPVRDDQLVKVMYTNGAISQFVRCAYAWKNWTGGRDWWKNPGDGRLSIMMYVVI